MTAVHAYGEAAPGEGSVRVTGPDEHGVVVVEMAREHKHNAINLPMMKAMADLFGCLGRGAGEDLPDPRGGAAGGGGGAGGARTAARERERAAMRGRYGGVRAAVLTGAGSRSFCSGVDLTAARAVFQGDIGGDDDSPFVALASRCAVPVVAAINGAAFTAGLELAISCDVVVAGPAASFADTHCKYGIMPSGGASQRLPRIVGASRAKYMALTSRPVPAATAHQWGLANVLVPTPEEAVPAALDIARAAASNNQAVVRGYKSNIDDGMEGTLAEGMAMEKERAYEYYRSMPADLFERMKSFKRDSRPPAREGGGAAPRARL